EQERNHLYAQKKIAQGHDLISAYEQKIGLPAGTSSRVMTAKPTALSLPDFLKSELGKNLQPLVRREASGEWQGLILLSELSSPDQLKTLLAGKSGLILIDHVGDISALFGRYRHFAGRLVVLAYALVYLVLLWRYGFRKSILTFLPAFTSGLLTLGV